MTYVIPRIPPGRGSVSCTDGGTLQQMSDQPPSELPGQPRVVDTRPSADRTTSVLLLVDVAGLTVRVDAPDDWADPLLAVLCRRCPALPPALPPGAPSGDGATLPFVAAGAAGTACGGAVGYAWAFFDSSATATLPLPHLGRTLSAPTGGMVRPSASLGDRSSAPQDPVCDLVCDVLAQARWLLIDVACQRCGVQTHWAATRAEAEALLALWGPLVSPALAAFLRGERVPSSHA